MNCIKALIASILFLALSVRLPAAQVTVFAAASLTDSLKQIAAAYQKNSGDTITFNFAASGTLERQIEAGAPADLFFSADEAQMNKLAAKNLLQDGSRRDVLGNTLVLITPAEHATLHSVIDLTNAAVQHIALGDPKSVPAGAYAQSYLQKIGCWTVIQPRVIPCESVRAVLAVVESGNADAGIVYKTDAAISHKITVASEVSQVDGPQIVYPVAGLKSAPQTEAAAKFLAYLSSAAAAKVFQQFGFLTLESSPAK